MRIIRNPLFLLMLWILSSASLTAQSNSGKSLPFIFFSHQEPSLKLDMPLFDLPYQIDAMHTVGSGFFSSYANPSMTQSLSLTVDMFSAFHYGMEALYQVLPWNNFLREVLYWTGLGLGDLLLFYIPGGEGWLHEEFHRAVMTRFGVNSFNDMNTFPLGAELVSVHSVTDEDLERFKAESPQDFIRMHEAGIEGEYLLIDRLQRNNFFYDQHLNLFFPYMISTLNSHLYILASGDPRQVDVKINEMNQKELSISSRDFTGFDMAGWVYDLFRPQELYRDRGVHPSGIGINRYRKTTDLTDEELHYLKQQAAWHIFNYISPMFFAIDKILLGDGGLYGNFAFRHLLTSFGTDLSLTVFLKKPPFNLVCTYHNYLNYDHYFPALEGELIDLPVSLGMLNLYVSPRVILGMQPGDQEFKTAAPEFLGLAGCRVDFRITKYALPYFDVTAKTRGWVWGNEFLTSNVSVKMGVSMRF